MYYRFVPIVFLAVLTTHQKAWPAACCGGSSALPAIISSDNKAQMSLSYSFTEVAVNSVDNNGLWYTSSEKNIVRNLKIEGSHIIEDLWQLGFSLPVQETEFAKQKKSGISDISLFAGYEFLPVWDYHPYKPKGIGFLQLNLPTGKSKFEVDDAGLESRGNGQWSIGMGALFTKTFTNWDATANFEAHHNLQKDISSSQGRGTILPSDGHSYGFGIGYNIGDLRLGAAGQWNQESAKDVEFSSYRQDGFTEQYATASLSFAYMINDTLSFAATATDQTVLGDPKNTSLAKGIAVSMQTTIPR